MDLICLRTGKQIRTFERLGQKNQYFCRHRFVPRYRIVDAWFTKPVVLCAAIGEILIRTAPAECKHHTSHVVSASTHVLATIAVFAEDTIILSLLYSQPFGLFLPHPARCHILDAARFPADATCWGRSQIFIPKNSKFKNPKICCRFVRIFANLCKFSPNVKLDTPKKWKRHRQKTGDDSRGSV